MLSPAKTAPSSNLPLVTCVMVTADRGRLCARAILCFERQTYPNRELLVLDDGRADISPRLSHLDPARVRYLRLSPVTPRRTLGAVRNIGLTEARGDLIAQWDDDDWYHPDRLLEQVQTLGEGEACVLDGTLLHVAEGRWGGHPFTGCLRGGVPGTILHRREERVRYPELARAEDKEFLSRWARRGGVRVLAGRPHLFIRCFHGGNTWSRRHFLRRMRNQPQELLAYAWWAWVRRDIFRHPAFRLDREAGRSFEHYLQDSIALGLLEPTP